MAVGDIVIKNRIASPTGNAAVTVTVELPKNRLIQYIVWYRNKTECTFSRYPTESTDFEFLQEYEMKAIERLIHDRDDDIYASIVGRTLAAPERFDDILLTFETFARG